ncbi:hypothetical protein SISSUDRAFT_1046302 [Sistotremastrum suecicum HHB10207 ss-3]|uniref:Golgi apparatus membrane protein TVP38 n=1 Tax=Sistotremastrum suecicum HHB10207 ss-3 TaxID=1314776 RepID=A0A166DWS2_9AGAM|nr:hypothetical protein SISSUDRAFT_1046302 [Sistotremastrum suecicum HHB10207 ss-3]
MSDRRPWSPFGPSSLALPVPTSAPPSQTSHSHSSSNHRYLRYVQLAQQEPDHGLPQHSTLPLEDVSLSEKRAYPHSHHQTPAKSTISTLESPPNRAISPNRTTLPASRLSLDASRPPVRVALPPRLSASSPLYHPPRPPHPSRFHSHDVEPPNGILQELGDCIPERLRAWIPFLLWVLTTVGFLLAVTVWRTEVFQGLDDLAHTLRDRGAFGYSVLFLCIFLTTFPPLPLYSTFIVLSGYTFGARIGFVISYGAALTGAITVFVLSRLLLRSYITSVLNRTLWIKRVVRAIEKRPKLLFLIRVAPYPYNVMNALLAASPTLTFQTYTLCTALSLVKLIVHTTIGSTIHDFAAHSTNRANDDNNDVDDDRGLGRAWAIVGISLCVGIFVYLTIVARRAVDEELEEDQREAEAEAGTGSGSRGEAEAFLGGREMSEVELIAAGRRS